jgi:hypothetical protein
MKSDDWRDVRAVAESQCRINTSSSRGVRGLLPCDTREDLTCSSRKWFGAMPNETWRETREDTYLGDILKMTLGVGGVEGVHGCSVSALTWWMSRKTNYGQRSAAAAAYPTRRVDFLRLRGIFYNTVSGFFCKTAEKSSALCLASAHPTCTT